MFKIIDIIKNLLYKVFVTNAYINCIRKCFVEIKFYITLIGVRTKNMSDVK